MSGRVLSFRSQGGWSFSVCQLSYVTTKQKVLFCHRHGMISDQLFQTLPRHYQYFHVPTGASKNVISPRVARVVGEGRWIVEHALKWTGLGDK